jgi:phospholipid-binding lipoprotein MlaA
LISLIFPFSFRQSFGLKLAALILPLALLGCGAAPIESGINDPNEEQNRGVHRANRNLDRFILRPTANAYGTTIPQPVRTGIGNVASNLNLPGMVLNDLLQLRIEDATANTFRFLMNTTFGLGGTLDIATEAGIAERSTDFGETLHVWGIKEGAYMEFPGIGPSTERHMVGRIVDTALNPLNLVVPSPERGIVTATGVAARFGDRYRLSDLVDSILYESEDSYAQARLLYLQTRRFQLGGEAETEYLDPYEDIYGAE